VIKKAQCILKGCHPRAGPTYYTPRSSRQRRPARPGPANTHLPVRWSPVGRPPPRHPHHPIPARVLLSRGWRARSLRPNGMPERSRGSARPALTPGGVIKTPSASWSDATPTRGRSITQRGPPDSADRRALIRPTPTSRHVGQLWRINGAYGAAAVQALLKLPYSLIRIGNVRAGSRLAARAMLHFAAKRR
jgi:hypothetical protein